MSSSLLKAVEQGIARFNDAKLVRELLESYAEAKKNYYLGGLRLSAVEGGRFCEAAFRMLEQRVTGSFTPIGAQLDTNALLRRLENQPATASQDSIRLHIPRALRMIYDIRNKRDAAHLADGIDPNLQDATLVVSVLDWVLAEFVRLYHTVPPNEAQLIVDSLVEKRAPAVQDFNGFLKVLNPNLPVRNYVLLLLYQKGLLGATFGELAEWVRPTMRANLQRTLNGMSDGQAYIHTDGSRYFITRTGIKEVERLRLYEIHNQDKP